MDQYSDPLPEDRSSMKPEDAERLDSLLNALYRFNPFHHGAACTEVTPTTDGLCYCIVTRVPLGCIERTTDGYTSLDHNGEDGSPLSIFYHVRSPATPLLSTTRAERRRAALRRPTPSTTSLPPAPYTTTALHRCPPPPSTLHHPAIPSSPRWALTCATGSSGTTIYVAVAINSTCTRCWRTCTESAPDTARYSTSTTPRHCRCLCWPTSGWSQCPSSRSQSESTG